MTPNHLYILVLAIVAVGVSCQNDIPVDENDNQFPPENPETIGLEQSSDIKDTTEQQLADDGEVIAFSTTAEEPAQTINTDSTPKPNDDFGTTSADETTSTLIATPEEVQASSFDSELNTTSAKELELTTNADLTSITTSENDQTNSFDAEPNTTSANEQENITDAVLTSTTTLEEGEVSLFDAELSKISSNEQELTTDAVSTSITTAEDVQANLFDIELDKTSANEQGSTTVADLTSITTPEDVQASSLDEVPNTTTTDEQDLIANPTLMTTTEDSLLLTPTLENEQANDFNTVTETIKETTTNVESTPEPQLTDGQAVAFAGVLLNTVNDEQQCPERCKCDNNTVDSYEVDCSGIDLTELPFPIDERTTKLNIQNNQLTQLQKNISLLKNLKELNAENNLIMDLDVGSVSELPELTILKLANNRLIEYPKDLKEATGLTKLKELDLGGNDMRPKLTLGNFENLKGLQKLILGNSTSIPLQMFCSLNQSLEIVCATVDHCVNCSVVSILNNEITLPGAILTPEEIPETNVDESEVTPTSDIASPVNIASRTAFKNEEIVAPIQQNSVKVEVPKNDTDVKVGATTTSTTKGGVDKSVIGLIVAGMVVVIAGITIKKNWSSIKKRFSSSSRTPQERSGANANGTTPEEVPLQEKHDKSPV